MHPTRSSLAACASAMLALAALPQPAATQSIGAKPPAIDAVKWYNTPPLALDALRGKAVLVEVFRTW